MQRYVPFPKMKAIHIVARLHTFVEKSPFPSPHFFTRSRQWLNVPCDKAAFAFLRNETDALEAAQEATCRAYMKLSSHTFALSDYPSRLSQGFSLPLQEK